MNVKLIICIIATMFGIGGCSFQGNTNTEITTRYDISSSWLQSKQSSSRRILPKKPLKHIVIVIEENHSYVQVAGNPKAPYINELIHNGANFTNYHGVGHPSEPNYLSLFSGENQGVTDDSCPHAFTGVNLATELHTAGFTFGGYSEDLPSIGYTGCSNGSSFWHLHQTYARKHNPWVNFTNVPTDENMPFGKFPKDFTQLPTVSIVVPNLNHDMHNGSIHDADFWLKQNLDPYKEWNGPRHMIVCLLLHGMRMIIQWTTMCQR